MRDVPWDQALDIILRANKLGYSVDGTIVRIAPLTTLANEEKERGDAGEGAGRCRAADDADASAQLLEGRGDRRAAQGRRTSCRIAGTAFVDTRTNTLIVTDLQERLTNTSDLIDTLDKPQPQVEIEARIVQTNKTYARALGIQWGFNGAVSPALGNTTGLAFPNSGTLGGRAPGIGVPPNTAVNLPATRRRRRAPSA